MSDIENSQKANQNFEVDSVKYQLEEKHVDDLSLLDTSVNPKHHDPPQCKPDLTEIRHLQRQDMHLSKINTKCIS